ncbi:hypothetical protein Trydic_g7557 [Trypoxylus dichotomus]
MVSSTKKNSWLLFFGTHKVQIIGKHYWADFTKNSLQIALICQRKPLFHYDSAYTHSSAVGAAKWVDLCYELVPHPYYFSD